MSDAKAIKKPRISVAQVLNKYGIVFILIGICILMSILTPAFFSIRNLTNVIRQVSIIGILAIGVTFAIITTGIDLSSGSVLALVGVVVASLSQTQIIEQQPVAFIIPIFFSILIGLALGAVLGTVNGSLHAYGKIPAFIATLGMMTVARGLADCGEHVVLVTKDLPMRLKAGLVRSEEPHV